MAVVGILDSGVGGLSVLKEVLKALPREHYVYYSDNAWCPYGDKDTETITDRCRTITDLFLSKGADAVVIACNTATSAAIATLRSEYDVPFVGMEPAVKPAALETRTGIIGVLATAGTLKGVKYLDSKEKYGDGIRIVEAVGRGFVELVESGELDGQHTEEVCRAALTPLLEAGADNIVLGCTHYPFLLPVLQRIAGPLIRFIDPAPAIARRLADILDIRETPMETPPAYDVELLSSGPSEPMERMFAKIRSI